VSVSHSADGERTWAWVAETVDAGIDYAYTMVGNNFSGRVSRGALACGNGQVLARTSWYWARVAREPCCGGLPGGPLSSTS